MLGMKAVPIACLALIAFSGELVAQTYPNKPIQVVVPFAPGGAVDLYARVIASKISEMLNQKFVIENRPGAGGNIAASFVAKSEPDGHTVLQNQSGQAISPSIYRKLPFDPERDFAPVTLLLTSPILLVASGKAPFKTFEEFISAAKSSPRKWNYASAGVGTSLHFAMELLKARTGIEVVHVPYKGVAPAINSLIAGEVDVGVMPYLAALPHESTGALRILAVTSAKRTSLLPNVPTIAESGVPGYDLLSWMGWFVAANTPKEIVDTLQREAAKALQSPDIRDRLKDIGAEPVGSTPEQFTKFYHNEIALYRRIAREAKIELVD